MLLSSLLSSLASWLAWLVCALLVALVSFLLFVTLVNALCNARYRAATTPSRDDPIALVRRNWHFGLEQTRVDDVSSWNGHGRLPSLFLGALSLFFPAGERMFVRAVQHHQQHPAIQADAKLKAACAAFVSQESVHGREHDYLNERLKEQYPIAAHLERIVEVICTSVTRFLPYRSHLGTTVALEHWTAIMAGFLLTHPLGPNGGVFGTQAARDSRFGLVWQWHACEETEHKAVAFDVYERYYGRGLRAYIGRCFSLITSTIIFWTLVPVFTVALAISDGELLNFAGWFEVLSVLWLSPGMIPRIWPAFCDYFRYDFHPWDHNNMHQIAHVHELEQKLKEFQAQDDEQAQRMHKGHATSAIKSQPPMPTPNQHAPDATVAASHTY